MRTLTSTLYLFLFIMAGFAWPESSDSSLKNLQNQIKQVKETLHAQRSKQVDPKSIERLHQLKSKYFHAKINNKCSMNPQFKRTVLAGESLGAISEHQSAHYADAGLGRQYGPRGSRVRRHGPGVGKGRSARRGNRACRHRGGAGHGQVFPGKEDPRNRA